jgi:hypothetical protein
MPRHERPREKEGQERGTGAEKKKRIQKPSDQNPKLIICPRKVVSHVFHWTQHDDHRLMLNTQMIVTAEVIDAFVPKNTCNVHMLRHVILGHYVANTNLSKNENVT